MQALRKGNYHGVVKVHTVQKRALTLYIEHLLFKEESWIFYEFPHEYASAAFKIFTLRNTFYLENTFSA